MIIGGEDYDSWQNLIDAENQPKVWGATIGFWGVFALVLFMMVLSYFTRPLRALARDVKALESAPLDTPLALPKRYSGSGEISDLTIHINHLLSEINQHQQEMKRQQQIKHDFLLHLSHDLKTPLTSLLGYIDTWLLLPESERSEALIQYAANSGQTLQQLLAQLLELAALENGQIKTELQRVNLDLLLQDIKQTFTPRANKLDIRLNFSCVKATHILTDPQLMKRILNNLIDNALRYTPSGGEIAIFTEQGQDSQWLSVKDTGSGMHQHELEALRQLSSQSQPSTKRIQFAKQQNLPQLGVGLAIVQQLLGLLKCKIEIDSQPGEGCEFKIELHQIMPSP